MVYILEMGSADYVSVNRDSGFAKSKHFATQFKNIAEFFEQCSHDKRYSWIINKNKDLFKEIE